MNIQRKAIILMVFLLCLLLLSGCIITPIKGPDSTKEPSDISTTDGIESIESTDSAENTDSTDNAESTDNTEKEPAELYALQSRIKDADCAVGIALVDYIESELSEEDTTTYLNYSETVEKYPFLSNIKTVAYSGIELFVIVPASSESVITIFPVEINNKGEIEVQRDKVIYKSKPGEPIALKCNMSEIYSNVLVSVTNGSEVCEFNPMISLKDSWSIVPQEGCYDFSIDNIRKYTDDLYYMLPKTYPEIQEALDNGKDLVFGSDFYFCNQMMLRFELGQYGNDGFVCEKNYAVSFDATYAMDPSDHNWYVIGAGVKGMGLQK